MPLKENSKIAVILLSGGMDSATSLAMATREGYHCHTLAFDYGQRHRRELEMAARQSRAWQAAGHQVVRVDLACIGGSALTASIEIPKDEEPHSIPVHRRQPGGLQRLSRLPSAFYRGVRERRQSGHPHGNRRRQNPCARTAAGHEQGANRQKGPRTGCGLQEHPHLLRSGRLRHRLRSLPRLPIAPQGFCRSGNRRSAALRGPSLTC
jgi:hypothetical protein